MSKIAFVIVGATGDLTKRKLIPAFEALNRCGVLKDSVVIGTGRTNLHTEEFRTRFPSFQDFRNFYYHTGFKGLNAFVASLGPFDKTIAIFAVPPSSFVSTAVQLREDGFSPNTQIVLEKPIGYDLETSNQINLEIERLFNKESVFRMDHYLGKEAVQNILIFRFANMLFEPIWNDQYIDSIQISITEEIGVEQRGKYFDESGILRDIIQNHVLQLIALLTMECPLSLSSVQLREKKEEVLSKLEALDCCKFQYSGYQSEEHVDCASTTETYACIKFRINNPRWQHTSIVVRAGKALGRSGAEIGIRFKKPQRNIFGEHPLKPNIIVLKIQPYEGIITDIQTKSFGRGIGVVNGRLSYCFDERGLYEGAYEKLFRDLIEGVDLFFVGAQETEMSWKILSNVLTNVSTNIYNKGEECPACLAGIEWINFDEYAPYCSIFEGKTKVI